ncbi:conserved hypothetical protein [Thermotomaculum hydrothermale]|uniref:Alginate export domain-containing protein n=1 Tax=Thermotomaculum hydrothermale TaxID=981385 RepID=A0A7R6PNS4_9BACT|nr:alginate export family protein [Thermotomaculum hydrothermale]BBB33038.1 conserved hypothetical protein [Thermotomaculum hydrothermale]
MKKYLLSIISILLMFTFIPAFAGGFLDSIKDGKATLELRFSFEYSDLDDPADLDSAKGLNLRTRLGFKTADYNGFSMFLQMHNLSQIVDDYRWPGGGDPAYDVIADPDGSRVHQFFFTYKFNNIFSIKAGRQEIIFDDARLIGNVGWRQNGQSFDGAVLAVNTDRNNLSFAYIYRVNTILLTHVDLDGLYAVHDTFKVNKNMKITAFAYLLDTESDSPDSRDSGTYGLRFLGSINNFNYDLTYAIQNDFADGENHGGDMVNAFIEYKFENFALGVGCNLISGQDGNDRPFDTLFSTAHKFNGWADQFLGTNGGKLVNGLDDYFVQFSTKIYQHKLVIVYHSFDTNENVTYGEKYGDELDILVVRKINKNLSCLAKAAFYNAKNYENNPTLDEKVVWFRVMYKF